MQIQRILPDGDNDNGKGWQCSKYSWFLATGIRMNYAPHPDYGPCNDDKMIDYLIQKLGWVECTKMDVVAEPVPTFKVGDTVRPLRKVDYDGRHLRQYDDCYTITQINGDRAVLMARGQVWAAMNTRDIEKC